MRRGPHKAIMVSMSARRMETIMNTLKSALANKLVGYLDKPMVLGTIRTLNIRLAKEGDK